MRMYEAQGKILLAAVAVLAFCCVAPAQAMLTAPSAAPAATNIPPPKAAPTMSPTQVAYLQSVVKQSRRQFAAQAATIAGVPAEKILPHLPSDWRAGDPRYAIIPALEKLSRAPLTDDQRQKITEADRNMKSAIAQARIDALKR